ncbi:1,6-anhydro-N-acetylmuramyl-L-alanine amidase AmpD [Billgrantia desiderata]|uniref:1,6-anhydro-N-acetylmuramyl-L-alanine amidase AmpD n=1 Tax=Billgrantia desiderata TaxID=52021 RepID=A0AAW4YPA0_9GAMM|nr:1,6-anhydro-N-acetylmuramyl-L-alanine amidase AmpD [Halomonas desiderata]MCE8014221.1 1,6-anhydro-N-acetylmuramyl-L-alanine amidase AmpD [Halomonas desiderata]MCE8028352.1 1,6-anhydro-N-acetylmuramyl-L-alanine amidase AmpD [Halomonas desiderata]MCE8050239.1 1,6-anhydro-N-acetylmuramyl-L-alanine amidase AmpD [Halomonas desiderata]NIC39028.1 1,6-anhydro-N-acetylmuramyl-L-alanine amidase AmpD [Halomonas desiderata]SEF77020.1 AmpD protein [Halomonas desiderata]
MRIEEGWLEGVRRVVSPNQDARPQGEVSAVVLHSISLPPGEFGGEHIERLFTNTLDAAAHPFFPSIVQLRVSAHLLIRRDGECVQFVPFDRRAWHAGRSCWIDEGRIRRALNDFTVGIELEGDEIHAYREAQYRSLAAVTKALKLNYPDMNYARITSHARVAPLRKNDPGPAFDWAYFRQCLKALG